MDVHDFLDWRDLVRAAFQDRGLTQRDLAHLAGVSVGTLSMLLTGRRSHPSTEQVGKLADVLFPSAADRAWFEALVDLQDPNPRARRAAEAVVRNTLAHLTAPSPAYELVELQSDWRANAILELASCEEFRPDPAWIAGKLSPPIAEPDAAALWCRLLATKLVSPRADGGFDVRSVLQPPNLRRRAAVAAAAMHESVLGLAAASIHRSPRERWGGVVTMALSEAAAERMLVRVGEMTQELVAMAADDPGPRNRVFLATVQLFPCSEFTDSVSPGSADVDEEPGTAAGPRAGDDGPG